MVSEMNKHGAFTTTNANDLDQQRKRKLYNLVPEILTVPYGIRKKKKKISKMTKPDHIECVHNSYTWPEKSCWSIQCTNVHKFKKFVEGKKLTNVMSSIIETRKKKKFLSFWTNITFTGWKMWLWPPKRQYDIQPYNIRHIEWTKEGEIET